MMRWSVTCGCQKREKRSCSSSVERTSADESRPRPHQPVLHLTETSCSSATTRCVSLPSHPLPRKQRCEVKRYRVPRCSTDRSVLSAPVPAGPGCRPTPPSRFAPGGWKQQRKEPSTRSLEPSPNLPLSAWVAVERTACGACRSTCFSRASKKRCRCFVGRSRISSSSRSKTRVDRLEDGDGSQPPDFRLGERKVTRMDRRCTPPASEPRPAPPGGSQRSTMSPSGDQSRAVTAARGASCCTRARAVRA
mmetsp:Transcript_26930/g.78508  ORF Transcript_26930/g.78508 Transcript_26930/m.78508 type:complete len:249 (+) Transcript_26930:3385-4131(+)